MDTIVEILNGWPARIVLILVLIGLIVLFIKSRKG